MKRIYFVRHGETEANKKHIHQSSDEELTPKGKLQAHHVSHFLEGMQIDAVLCSPYARARQTAEIISKQLHLPYTEEENVVEVRRPDHLYGQGYYSPQTLLYMWRLFIHRENPNWECDGAENMYMLRNRIENVKKTIAELQGQSIAVVTHDVFMNLFFEHVCRDKRLSLRQFIHVLTMSKKTPNAGVIHMEYQPNAPKGVCAWQFIEMVDTAIAHKT